MATGFRAPGFRWRGPARGAYLVPALLALLAAGLGGGVGQAAAGRGRLLVPLLVAEPGEGHAGGDGGHGLGGGDGPPGLLQEVRRTPGRRAGDAGVRGS